MINITEEEKYFVWLNSFPFLTKAKIKEMKDDFGSYKNIFLNANKESSYFKTKFSDGEVSKLFYASTDEFVTSLFKNLEAQGIGVLTNSSKGFEKFFNEVAPMAGIDVLYYKGDINLINSKCVSIVGTRKPDSYGRQVTEEFAKALATKGLTIVSGLAAGVDSIAHETAIKCNAKTIAVLAGGFNHIYPAFNKGLADEIVKCGGLLLSEYQPQIIPSAFHFPIRNRIIAGLSDAVLITQAGEKSGSMHTKNYAIDYGKELFIVPADITREASKGTNEVLKVFPHAVAISPDIILEYYGLDAEEKEATEVQLTIEEKLVIESLGGEELHFSEILAKTGLESKILSSLLTTLRVSGIIKQLPGNYYSKC